MSQTLICGAKCHDNNPPPFLKKMRATPGSLFEIMLHCKKPQSQEMVQKKVIQIVLRNKKYVA